MTLFQYFKGKMIAFYKIFTEMKFSKYLIVSIEFVRSEVYAVESYFLFRGTWSRVKSIAA